MTCEFAHKVNWNAPIGGNCYNNKASRRVVIRYNELETETLLLCPSCAKIVTKDARRHSYKVTNQKA